MTDEEMKDAARRVSYPGENGVQMDFVMMAYRLRIELYDGTVKPLLYLDYDEWRALAKWIDEMWAERDYPRPEAARTEE
jgi:hypothetical protein